MILIIGNFLTVHGYNPTFLELLANDLKLRYNVYCVSKKKNKLIRLLNMCFHFYKNLIKIKLVIIDTYSTKAYFFALVISCMSKIHNKPYILILSGGNLKARLKKSPSFSNILKNSSKNISPSIYLCNIFKNYNTFYIPNYIDLNQYPFRKRTKIKPNILWVRSFHKIYNPKMAILVLNMIVKNYPEARLCMIGPSKDNSINEVKELITKFKLKNHITITGKLNKKDWISKSTDYDIFINTTNYDNLPVTLLEVMALGLPIVSTNVGGIPNLIRDYETGILVERDNSNEMAEKIISIIDNQVDGKEISENGRMEAETYDVHILKQKWFKLIDEVLNK